MKKFFSYFLIVTAMTLLCITVTTAQDTTNGNGDSEEQMANNEDEKAGLVSFDFKDADIRNVLRIFSHKTGIC